LPTFDYEASAELFAARGHSGFLYQRFTHSAEAILLARSSLEVNDQCYNAARIRALYVSELYSLSRNKRAL
jgi:hypothetical protein